MKKTLILALLLSILSVTLSYAKIITVDNKHPYVGDFKTLQEAHDAATAGDIIYVSPSLIPYAAITVTKQLTFYGVGFDITENIGEPMTPTASISGLMTFENASTGSHIEGFDGTFAIYVKANIIVKKNNLSYVYIWDQGSGSTVLQNKIESNSEYTLNLIPFSSLALNVLISNNIIINTNGGYTIWGGSDIYILNNIIYSYTNNSIIGVGSSQVLNNIIVKGNFGSNVSSVFMYNMANSNQLPEGNGNINNIDMNTVFVDYANYDFHLLPNSPAKGAGQNGTDMGIYGGDTPYVDCGFPGLPSILQIQTPNAGSQQSGLDINFKAKSNKE